MFIATAPEDPDSDQPPGAALMRRLSAGLTRSGWSTDAMDNWRDCGWSLMCRRNTSEFEVLLGQVETGEWLLQVSPYRVPGIIGTFLGRKPSAIPSEVHALAVAAHRVLASVSPIENPRWCWDGLPDEQESTPEPETPSQTG